LQFDGSPFGLGVGEGLGGGSPCGEVAPRGCALGEKACAAWSKPPLALERASQEAAWGLISSFETSGAPPETSRAAILGLQARLQAIPSPPQGIPRPQVGLCPAPQALPLRLTSPPARLTSPPARLTSPPARLTRLRPCPTRERREPTAGRDASPPSPACVGGRLPSGRPEPSERTAKGGGQAGPPKAPRTFCAASLTGGLWVC
jgi:hypothetical protein